MEPKVKLTITNVNNTTFRTIIIRKFFNMVFLEADGKTLTIYTATVYGGSKFEKDQIQDVNHIVPVYVKDTPCTLRFGYSISLMENDKEIEAKYYDKIEFQDVTEEYLSQPDEINHVWDGVQTLDSQKGVKDALSEFYMDYFKSEKNINVPDIKKVGIGLKISGKKPEDPPSNKCVAFKGKFTPTHNQNEYTLSSNHLTGIEAVNWIKTTLVLKSSILDPDKKVDFALELDNDSSYYTPDFTWYFAPPPGYVVRTDSAGLTIGDDKNIQNKVASVADITTVKFKSWTSKERILERKKARIILKDQITENPYILSEKGLCVTLSFLNPGKHSNRQFFLGLLIGFLLSFCSDKTRLNDFLEICKDSLCSEGNCISFWASSECVCANICNLLGILFPVMIILAFFALSFSRKRCIPEKKPSIIFARIVGMVATFFLVLYIDFFWMVFPNAFKNVITSCLSNQRVIIACTLLSLLGNGIYVLYCGVWKKNNIVDFF